MRHSHLSDGRRRCSIARVALAASVMLGLVALTPTADAAHASSAGSGGRSQAAARRIGLCGDEVEICLRRGRALEGVVSDPPGGCIVHYDFNWGDGTASQFTVPPAAEYSHTYNALGVFTKTVTGTADPASPSICAGIDWDHPPLLLEVIPQLKVVATLNDIDDKPLSHLSTDSHPYFAANTRIHGTVTVTGAVNDQLGTLDLEVRRGDVRAFASLSDGARRELIGVPFGADHKVSIEASELLFELPSSRAALFNRNVDGPVQLRLTAGAALDGTLVRLGLGERPRLVRYKQSNRYGPAVNPRDEDKGGDDWVRPTVRPVLFSLHVRFPNLLYGDMSNMNGGRFPPHGTHRNGTDIDVWFPGYNKRSRAVARTLIKHLNDPLNGSSIQSVLVEYNKPGGRVFPGRPNPDPFWLAIRNVILTDGRRARNVILPRADHDTHFHWTIDPVD